MKAVVARQQPMTLTTPSDVASVSDAELLRLMAAGDERAFITLYQRHQGPVYRFALLMTGAANVAEEVTQEIFLAMIREPHRYDPARASLSAYLYGMARNRQSGSAPNSLSMAAPKISTSRRFMSSESCTCWLPGGRTARR